MAKVSPDRGQSRMWRALPGGCARSLGAPAELLDAGLCHRSAELGVHSELLSIKFTLRLRID